MWFCNRRAWVASLKGVHHRPCYVPIRFHHVPKGQRDDKPELSMVSHAVRGTLSWPDMVDGLCTGHAVYCQRLQDRAPFGRMILSAACLAGSSGKSSCLEAPKLLT